MQVNLYCETVFNFSQGIGLPVVILNACKFLGMCLVNKLWNEFLGWIKTFEKYYTAQVRNILNSMVTKLKQYEKMRFIYAEMSFFSRWWEDISETTKDDVKQYVFVRTTFCVIPSLQLPARLPTV